MFNQFSHWLTSSSIKAFSFAVDSGKIQPRDICDECDSFWIDEKYFCFNQKLHKQITSTEYPHKSAESNNRSDEKVTILVAIFCGKVTIVHPFVDENGRNDTVNDTCYLDLLNEVVWFTFRSSAKENGTGGCRMALRYVTQQKDDIFLPKSSGAEWLAAGPRPDDLPTRMISIRSITTFWHWSREESAQQSHQPLQE